MDMQRQDHSGLHTILCKLGLKEYYPNKLTLHSLLEINKNNITDSDVKSVDATPWCFLRKLFRINAECRACAHFSERGDNDDLLDLNTEEDTCEEVTGDTVNPLDLITALFLCADSFLQQELCLKMSMCQFSVPLLLPLGSQSQTSLMLWALRDILKEWCPHDMSESKGFVESSIVHADMPLYSFVRLKNCSLSKSKLLNNILSSGQQNHNIFMHRDMEGGTVPRQIANGLVEICWYLPCGRETLDTFPKPIAFANLRGDVCESIAQFHFLFQASTATFVLMDKVEEDEFKMLSPLKDVETKLFFIINRKQGDLNENIHSVKKTVEALQLPKSNLKIKDTKVDVTTYSSKLITAIKATLTEARPITNIEAMLDIAIDLGFSVDECKSKPQKRAADEIMKGIGDKVIPDYKKQQLPLQGNYWKMLAKLEKDECTLKVSGDLEEHKSKIQEEIKTIKKKQSNYKLSSAMKCFIESLDTAEKEQRDFFLQWLKLKLDALSRKELSDLRNEYKEQYQIKNRECISELDQLLLDSSLGIEHYMREMGQIYEVSCFNSRSTDKNISRLPGLAAELLLDGHPLELLDGDASNIPERWVTDVLMELHQKVGGRSRLLVLTVMGVQSTGKSTLLNTMFGVQFPVSSGRCTRGAFMLFIPIGEDMKQDLKCDFILLIDTEGLKSADLAQLADSYEHDNQLATLVIGLSDITIINIAMENLTEMKDVLQIAAHAFLRMNQVGKRPVCHFVHQNVASVSAHANNMTERQHLLKELNEMTQIAAEMEKQPSIKLFTDVMDYDVDKNNWYIPGLWHGTPPMAPVNTGYSEAVADFKKSLLKIIESDKNIRFNQIPEFVEWTRSLWKAVKYETFIFSFRNTFVVHVYDKLCKEFEQWEWAFEKEILCWQTAAEVEITNAACDIDCSSIAASKRSDALKQIQNQATIMKDKLKTYYKQKDKQVNLIEKHKVYFLNRINCFTDDITHSVNNHLAHYLDCKISSNKAQDIKSKCRDVIEKKVINLLTNCEGTTLTDEQLINAFERMWKATLDDISSLKEKDISTSMLGHLRNIFQNEHHQQLHKIDKLDKLGEGTFKARRCHIDCNLVVAKILNIKADLQILADEAIKTCTNFVIDKAKTNTDYHGILTEDLLDKIDTFLQRSEKQFKTNITFEIDLKLHICGIAAREFHQMHRNFLLENDPKTQLDKCKTQYLSAFIYIYKDRDARDCRKAGDFVKFCIRPAIEDYINRSLGINIVDEILTNCNSLEYSSCKFFQYSILKDLLQEDDFEKFAEYISKYKIYVKDWIFQHILQKMSEKNTFCKLKNNVLDVIVNKIMQAIKKASKRKNGFPLPDDNESIKVLIDNILTDLQKDISVSTDAVKGVLFQIRSTCHPFTQSLVKSLADLKEQLQQEFTNPEDIEKTLNSLPIKPHEEIFKRVFGCGHQCPFCKVPCEAEGKDHKEHHAAVHRPQGLGTYRHVTTQKLIETLCTTVVYSKRPFKNKETNGQWHPYKEYRTYYPDWDIPPDRSKQASDYWKYVLVRYNDRFAERYKAKPADCPRVWKKITKEQALKGLKEAFNISI